MTDQYDATDAPKKWSAITVMDSIAEMRDRIESLEKLHTAAVELNERFNSEHQASTSSILHLAAETSRLGHRIQQLEAAQQVPVTSSPAADRVLALQDQIRDGALSLADALKEIGEPATVQPFTAKYLFTAGNIQQDSFYYDPSDSNSVLFDIANLELGDGCLTPGDNIKIAHRWGEPPASGVYSTINYKIASVSETEGRAWTIRALRVSSAPEPIPAPSPLPLTLVERVADAIAAAPFLSSPTPVRQARAAIREVAAWLQENPGPNSAWRAVARDLMDEANR